MSSAARFACCIGRSDLSRHSHCEDVSRIRIAAGVVSDAAADGSAPDRLIVSRDFPWARSGESTATFFRLPGGQISALRPPIFDSRYFFHIENIVAQIENLSLICRQADLPSGRIFRSRLRRTPLDGYATMKMVE